MAPEDIGWEDSFIKKSDECVGAYLLSIDQSLDVSIQPEPRVESGIRRQVEMIMTTRRGKI